MLSSALVNEEGFQGITLAFVPPKFEITSVSWINQTGQFKVFVQNVAKIPVTLSEVYVNGALDNSAEFTFYEIPAGATSEITLSETYKKAPNELTIKVVSSNGDFWEMRRVLINFQMQRVYWDMGTGQIKVLVKNTGDYRDINFGLVYVNGTSDNAAVIALTDLAEGIYEITLSGKYLSKPTSLLLTITTEDGKTFTLSSPFTGIMSLGGIEWDESTGHISCQVYIPSAGYFEGEQGVTFDGLYINGTRDESPEITRPYSETYKIMSSSVYEDRPSRVSVKVVTDFGAFGVGGKEFKDVETNYETSTNEWYQGSGLMGLFFMVFLAVILGIVLFIAFLNWRKDKTREKPAEKQLQHLAT